MAPLDTKNNNDILFLCLLAYVAKQHEDKSPKKKNRKNNKYRPPLEYPRFQWNLELWDDERVRRNLRFTREEIRAILPYTAIDTIVYRQNYRADPELALCLVLFRLSYPRQLHQMVFEFGCSEAKISTIINDVLVHFSGRYGQGLKWNPLVTYGKMQQYASKIQPQTGGGIWGFVDGTFIRTCRPFERQRISYSGYKKSHGFKYQAITTPDGLISHIDGPWEARVNDLTMIRRSGVNERLMREFAPPRRGPLYLFGDQAYKQQPFVISPYTGRRENMSRDQVRFNDRLSKARIAVENSFGLTHNLFTATAFKYGLESGQQPCALYFETAILLANCFVCLRGSSIGNKFGVEAPSLDLYLNSLATAA